MEDLREAMDKLRELSVQPGRSAQARGKGSLASCSTTHVAPWLEKVTSFFSSDRASEVTERDLRDILVSLTSIAESGLLDGSSVSSLHTSAIVSSCKYIRCRSNKISRGIFPEAAQLLAFYGASKRHRKSSRTDIRSIKEVLKVLLDGVSGGKDLIPSSHLARLKDTCFGLLSVLMLNHNTKTFIRHQSSMVVQLVLQILHVIFSEHRSCSEHDIQNFIHFFPKLIQPCCSAASPSHTSQAIRKNTLGKADLDTASNKENDKDNTLEHGDEAPKSQRYVPPHRRPSASMSGGGGGETTGSDQSESDLSDLSDAEGVITSENGLGKVCYITMQTLNAIVSLGPKALQPHFNVLFPSSQSQSPSGGRECSFSDANLLTLLSICRSVRIRILVAKTICDVLDSSSQQSYLSIAEVNTSGRSGPQRGFTTLSVSLGNILLNLHSVLRSLISSPLAMSVPALLAMEVRALAAVVQVCPYHRISEPVGVDLMGFMFEQFGNRLLTKCASEEQFVASAEDCALISSVINAFTVIVSKSELKPHLLTDLGPSVTSTRSTATQTNESSRKEMAVKYVWVMKCLSCNRAAPPGVRLDASISLHRFAKLEPRLVQEYMGQILKTIERLIDECNVSEVVGIDLLDKVCQQLVRAFSETFTLFGGDTANIGGTQGCDEDLRAFLVAYSESIVVRAIGSRSSVVVGAAFQSLLNLKREVVLAIRSDRLEQLTSLLCTFLCSKKNSIALRSSACKALGTILMLVPIASMPKIADMGMTSLSSLQQEASGTLQISLAWSVASVCDSLRSQLTGSQNGPGALPLEVSSILSEHLRTLADLAVTLTKSNDKVKCNAVRCLGCLFDVLGLVADEVTFQDKEGFKRDAIECILNALEVGNTKVQWNSCYAVGSYFKLERNQTFDSEIWFTILCRIAHLIEHSTNYKVQTHGVSAILYLESKEQFGKCFCRILQIAFFVLQKRLSLYVSSPQKTASATPNQQLLLQQQHALRCRLILLLMACIRKVEKNDKQEIALIMEHVEWIALLCQELFGNTFAQVTDSLNMDDRDVTSSSQTLRTQTIAALESLFVTVKSACPEDIYSKVENLVKSLDEYT